MHIFRKQPNEKFVIAVDFINILTPNEHIVSFEVVAYNNVKEIVTSEIIGETLLDATKCKIAVSGGQDKVSYKISLLVTTSDDNVYEQDVIMKLVDI